MSLSPEWRGRLHHWKDVLTTLYYRPLGTLPVAGFTTLEQLSPTEALARDFSPMPPGTPWGAKWEYGWFASEITLPEEAAGKRIVLKLNVGGESTVYLNGAAAGSIDRQHHEITLAMRGEPGARYHLLTESYAGHSARTWYDGPSPEGFVTILDPPATQVQVGDSSFGIWKEDIYQLWLDLDTLEKLRDVLEPTSLRVAEIDAALRETTLIVDVELPHDEMLATVLAGRERLRPLLACVNGSTAPTLFCVGHSHIDVAWLWPLQETERKCIRTMSTQLALMAEYPEYKFLQSQPHLYRMIKQNDPALYARIKEAVRAGQFIPEGGLWVEPDTNVTGGESLIRQFIHGKRFYRDEFGIESVFMWLPDVFGYSATLPQIMRGCGIKYFATAKILWNYNNGDPFPYNTFNWEGIDGSQILVHLLDNYGITTEPKSLHDQWAARNQQDNIATRFVAFGYGDGGGGATRDHLEYLRRSADLEGLPRTYIAHPLEYFRDQEARGTRNRYIGELYFQAHRGTYTTQARTKLGNRRSELALREAELWGVAARALAGFPFTASQLDEVWKTVLLNQFHDILPGSSIARVYQEAEAAYAEVLQTAATTRDAAISALTTHTPAAFTVFNSLSWSRTALVPVPEGMQPDAPVQQIAGATYAEVPVPACGWATVQAGTPTEVENTLTVTPRQLENAHLRVDFNAYGEISSLYDKDTDREWAAGPGNSFRMYKDVPNICDAWDIDTMYAQTPVELAGEACFEVVASGPLVAVLRITRKLHNSLLTQEVRLRRNSRRLEFHTVIDWQEKHKLLKVAFPVQVHTNEVVHEIQFGHLRRPNHASRKFDADRFEVAQQKWSAILEENRGFAVLNDCKYGLNVVDNSINLTLLKSSQSPDMHADLGRQEFTYAIYPWNGSFADSAVIREAYELNCPAVTALGASGDQSLFSLDAPNIIIETVKPAEDDSTAYIVRLYEAKRSATRCTLATTLPLRRALQTDMLENVGEELTCVNGSLMLEFKPFEIKTIRFEV